MFKILTKVLLSEDTYEMDIYAPRIAKSALPGQFIIIKMTEKGERIPLTISDNDEEKGTITIVFKAIGKSTLEMAKYNVGDSFADFVGPLGQPSEFVHEPIEELKEKKIVFIGGGVGIAPIYPQVKWLHQHGVQTDVIIGARSQNLLIYEDKLSAVSDNLYITTDDNSSGTQGLVTDVLRRLVDGGKKYDLVIAIGPIMMMKFANLTAAEYNIKCIVSLNSIMVDGTGMCGACRVSVGGQIKFSCVDGPEFDGALVDFDEVMKRQAMYKDIKIIKKADEAKKEKSCECLDEAEIEFNKRVRIPVKEQDPNIRRDNFEEVCLGYTIEEAVLESKRCLQCKKPLCVQGCPVSIDIPGFLKQITSRDFEAAAKVIDKDSALPAVCGRVCPQESQCEGLCIVGKKFDAVSIGKLERFVGDWSRENNVVFDSPAEQKDQKVAVIGSGPAGITCAKELLLKGYQVTVFEALHEYGGVLVYGIPSFRLPKETVVRHEIENIRKLGATFEKDVIIGRTVSIDSLMTEENFEAVFIGSGAGLPNFMNIPGENLCGVVSANEFLTRNNLLFAYKEGYDTPNYVGKNVVVIGGGNVAMDAARTAIRLGANVYVVYRRSEEELPARVEEVHHAKEEGIIFKLLSNPVEILGGENGWVNKIKCVKMELGEPDASGRRRPQVVKDSDFYIDTDMVIMSIGTSPNPLISSTTPGLEVNKWKCIVAGEEDYATSREGIFAGGDAVSGAATVIKAMGAGKQAAKSIDVYLQKKLQPVCQY